MIVRNIFYKLSKRKFATAPEVGRDLGEARARADAEKEAAAAAPTVAKEAKAEAKTRAKARVDKAIDRAEAEANELVSGYINYGEGIEERLTGDHETQRYDTFSYGVSDRGASIRIPWQVEVDKKGYLEDRRPNANADPYVIAMLMIDTICSSASS